MARYSIATSDDGFITLSDKASAMEATIAPQHGGEISSINVRGQQVVYRAREYPDAAEGWRGKAPVLFPAVGRHRDGIYKLATDSSLAAMGLHGFISKCAFRMVASSASETEASVTIEYASNDTVANHEGCYYPFIFSLTIVYTLKDGVLTAQHKVAHLPGGRGPTLMPFAIGNHITFKFPFNTQSGAWEDGSLSSSLTHEHCLTAGSLLSGQTVAQPALQLESGLSLREQLASNGVLGWDLASSEMDDFASTACWLTLRQPGALSVTFEQSYSGPRSRCSSCGSDVAVTAKAGSQSSCCNALTSADPHAHRHFVLWGDKDAGFICPEPWLSGPDSLNTLAGTPLLKAGEDACWTFTMRFER